MATTTTVQLQLSEQQAQLAHAALCDALKVSRGRQEYWLNHHEALAVKSPVMSGEAWKAFKLWEGKETAICQAIDAIRATGIELGLTAYGMGR